MTHRVAIIGGGAAGMMVATTLLEYEYTGNILLFEKNKKLGAKVLISGGGRCNLTTGVYKLAELKTKYPRGADFLTHALTTFGPRTIRRRFESHGVNCKQEADGRIFPVSDDGHDVVGVFTQLFEQNKSIQTRLGEQVKKIEPKQDGCFLITTSTTTELVDKVILTTGGNAYAHTGSTGDGYAWARDMGHTITPLGPSLNSFLTSEGWLHACSGISFPDACIHYQEYHIRGPVLLTHFGVSGPAVFAFSAHIPYLPINKETPGVIRLQIDAKTSVSGWQQRLLEWSTTTPKKEIGSLLREYFPKKFIDALLLQHAYDPHMFIGNVSKQQRLLLAELLGQGITLTLMQRRPGDEFVTAGGVCLDEVDPMTGQSLFVPGLYFAGEILDVDGYTGGYNLSSSRALGRVVGAHIAATQS